MHKKRSYNKSNYQPYSILQSLNTESFESKSILSRKTDARVLETDVIITWLQEMTCKFT